MIETSLGLPRKSSVIFGHLRKFSENVRQRLCEIRTSFVESSEIFGKSSQTRGRRYVSKKKEHYMLARMI